MAGSPDEAEQVLLSLEAQILPFGRRFPHLLRQEVAGWHEQAQRNGADGPLHHIVHQHEELLLRSNWGGERLDETTPARRVAPVQSTAVVASG